MLKTVCFLISSSRLISSVRRDGTEHGNFQSIKSGPFHPVINLVPSTTYSLLLLLLLLLLLGLQRVRGIEAVQLISTECVTCGGQSGILTGFYTSTSVLPPQYHSTTAPYSCYIHLPPMLYNLSNCQRPKKPLSI